VKRTVRTSLIPASRRRSIWRLASLVVMVVAIVVGTGDNFAAPVRADTYGGGSVQPYAAATSLDYGTVVQLSANGSNTVQPATKSNIQNMFGVTVDPAQLLVTTSDSSLQNETYVSVSGTYDALVSNEGGSIAAGDYLTLSSVDGVLMKAGTANVTVFGRAQSGFDGTGVTLGTTTLKNSAGGTQAVKLGSVPVTINIQRNPDVKSTKVDVPQFLQRLGQQIADKTVSPIRIYLSMAITAASIIFALVLLYAGVRNSVVAIGRNPMSKKSIFRALLQVILTSILVLIIGLFAVYLLLKL